MFTVTFAFSSAASISFGIVLGCASMAFSGEALSILLDSLATKQSFTIGFDVAAGAAADGDSSSVLTICSLML